MAETLQDRRVLPKDEIKAMGGHFVEGEVNLALILRTPVEHGWEMVEVSSPATVEPIGLIEQPEPVAADQERLAA